MKKPVQTCSFSKGITPSQPPVSVSVSNPAMNWKTMTSIPGKVSLSVCRHYNALKNRWGGLGRIKNLDAHGMLFNTSDEAWQYAYEHGYTQEYFTYPETRAKRVKEAKRPKGK